MDVKESSVYTKGNFYQFVGPKHLRTGWSLEGSSVSSAIPPSGAEDEYILATSQILWHLF